MAIILPPITLPPVTIYPEERSSELHIVAPVMGIPQITICNQHVDRDAEGIPIRVGPVETDSPYRLNMLEFLMMCPELSDIPGRISDAMDSMKERMPNRIFVPPQPTLISLSHNTGPSLGGTVVILTGTNFGYSMVVKFGNNIVPCQVPNRTTARCVVPAGPANQNVDVTVYLGPNSHTLPLGWTYQD